MLKVAINGFGRIGRTTMRAGWDRKDILFVAVNDLTAPDVLAHLLKYDSVFRTWDHAVKSDASGIFVDEKKIPVYAEKDPLLLPWGKLKVDVVIESTGFFTKQQDAEAHRTAGARKVVISAPSKDAPTFLMGVNHKVCRRDQNVINNASCTTNSIAPVAQIMNETFGVKKAMLTTVHSVTAEQNLVDGLPPGRKTHDLRRARSALTNIVPTTTGAAIATTEVVTDLKGKFDGVAIRVPSLDVSLTDFTFVTKRKTTVEEVRKTFQSAAKTARWKKVLGVSEVPLVSTDFIQSPYGSVVDLELIRVVDGDLVKVMAWYDNEWGYSTMLLDMVEYVGRL